VLVTKADELQLVERLRAGDDEAFARLMREEGPRLLRLTRRLMRTEEDARDCFQEAMLTVSRRIEDFQGRSSLGTWMYRVAANTCLMRLRKPSHQAERFIEDLMPQFDDRSCRINEASGPVPTPEHLLQREQTRSTVREAIAQLGDSYRAVLILRDIEERSAAEVAELMDLNVNAVNVRLHRARAALKRLLDPALFSEGTAARTPSAQEVTS
jgi:RNA polymerase sigma-70 factor, ECF subfamily